MGKFFNETWLLMIGALFGALIGKTIDYLLSGFGSIINWLGFIVTITIIWLLIYLLLRIYHKSN